MPATVILFVVLLTLSLVVGLYNLATGSGDLGGAVRVLLTGLFLVGVFKRHRLTWYWGRILGFLAGVIIMLAAASFTQLVRSAGVGHGLLPGIAMGGFGALLVGNSLLLGRASARRWFRLICPACQGMKSRAANFFFTRARCKACGAEY